MTWINTITSDPYQVMTLKLDNGETIEFTLRYLTNQQGWYYSFTYGAFSINNRALVCSPNLLRAFRHILPFGLACTTEPAPDGQMYEPIFKDDFSSKRAKFFLLNANDVADVESVITNAY
jgi:hypothetical protein